MKRLSGVFSAALCALAAVSLCVVLLLSSVQLIAFNEDYYLKSYARYGVGETIGTDEQTLGEITDTLLSYLKGNRSDLDMQADVGMKGGEAEVFTDTEKEHMVDVFWMFRNGFIVRDTALAVFAACMIAGYFVKKENFAARSAKTMLITFCALIVIAGIAACVIGANFSELFLRFHEVFFDNRLWLLHADESVLVNLVPEEFFGSIARDGMMIFGAFTLTAAIACAGVLVLDKRAKRKGNSDAV